MKIPKPPKTVLLALLIFLLAGGFIAAVFPGLSTTKAHVPPFSLFLATGVSMVVLTGVLFAYLSRLGLGFGKTALALALGYNAIIAIIKLTLSPYALYLANERSGGFDTTLAADPNNSSFYILTAVGVLMLYAVAFRLIYRYFTKRLQRRQLGGVKPASTTNKHLKLKAGLGILVLGLVGVFTTGGVVFVIVLLLVGAPISYLQYVFGALAVPLFVALAAAVYLAYQSFAAVERQAARTGNATLLASFFWLGLSLIALYHILWVVFLVTLVNIWPFSTYTSK
jgi:hypothetical protein